MLGATFHATRTLFRGCAATAATANSGGGGAVYADAAIVVLSDAYIAGAATAARGGAIYAFKSTLTMTTSTLQGFAVEGGGGRDRVDVATVPRGPNNDHSAAEGGAVYLEDSTGCHFADTLMSGFAGHVAAVFVADGTTVSMERTVVQESRADDHAGCMLVKVGLGNRGARRLVVASKPHLRVLNACVIGRMARWWRCKTRSCRRAVPPSRVAGRWPTKRNN